MTTDVPICLWCKHYNGTLKCDAFPTRIPAEILENEFDHRAEHEGDHGIQFEAIAGHPMPVDPFLAKHYFDEKGRQV